MRTRLSFPCVLNILLLACSWDEGAGSLGDGRTLWQQSKPKPSAHKQPFLQDTFPSGFLWGTGTSAFQTEGAWDKDGKGASIWDHFTHFNDSAATAEVASDSYAHWEEDVEALEYLGVNAYSLSISWPRLFPGGNPDEKPNSVAVEHYSRLIDRVLEKGMEPIVTLHHWDLPQVLQGSYGGWKNDSLVGFFEKYAAFCFKMYGDRVKYWLTMHNPYLVAVQGYGTGVHAPGESGDPSAPFVVAHNLIRAHASAWHIYNAQFRPFQGGKVSIVLGSHWVEPQNGQATPTNVELCQQSIEAVLGWFANPIFGDGDYPVSMKIKHSVLLPSFTPGEKLWVRHTADFFALSFGPNNLRLGQNPARYGQTVTPDLRRVLSWVKLEYGDLRVLVAEGGWFSEKTVGREDTVAIYLMKRFINQVLQAVRFDGVQVFGYTAWSLVDGYEWNYAYAIRRGLFHVDFSQPSRPRTPKTSAQYYKQVIRQNGFPADQADQEVKGRFPCEFHWGIADSTLHVQFYPFSPQFTDPQLYIWNITGAGALQPVSGVTLQTRGAQCTDYLAVRDHLRLFASTGATHYSFALNWSLILPQGDLSEIHTEALRYYRCILTELRQHRQQAVVTLYYPTHRGPNLGLPGPLQATGGWLNHSTVDAFRDYAALCYGELGPWVQHWITINEPNRFVDIFSDSTERYRAAHHLLLAHARAWRLYKEEYAGQQGALVSLALHADWAEPANPFLESHAAAAERLLQFELGHFLDPLLRTRYVKEDGDYPDEMRAYLRKSASDLGLPESPLPSFTDTEREEIKGAMGFIALNHFTTRLAAPYPSTTPFVQQRQPPGHGCLTLTDPTWLTSGTGQAVVPWGLRRVLRWVTKRYGRTLPIIVTASGIDDQASMEDTLRQKYLQSYLQEALKAHRVDGVNLHGFYMWRLQDRHAPRFGLFTSTHHHSKAKASVSLYRDIIGNGGFPEDKTKRACRFGQEQQPCSVCMWVFKNKALVVFGGCLLITAVMLVTLVVARIAAHRNCIRERGMRRMSSRRRREEVLVCSCPPVKCSM